MVHQERSDGHTQGGVDSVANLVGDTHRSRRVCVLAQIRPTHGAGVKTLAFLLGDSQRVASSLPGVNFVFFLTVAPSAPGDPGRSRWSAATDGVRGIRQTRTVPSAADGAHNAEIPSGSPGGHEMIPLWGRPQAP